MPSGKYRVEYVIRLDDDSVLVRLRVNGRMFDVEFGPEDLRDPLDTTNSQPFEQQYLDALQHSFSDDGSEGADEAGEVDEATESSELQSNSVKADSPATSECDREEDPVTAFAVGPFLTQKTFETFASELSTPCLNTLHDVLHPPLLSFGLHLADGSLAPVNRSPDEQATVDPPWAAIALSQHWLEYPTVKADEIVLASTSQPSPDVNLVMFDGRICWFKPVLPGVDKLPYIREIDILFELSREHLGESLRFPHLEAIVLDDKHGDRGFINGLILSAIHPNHGTIADRINGSKGPSLSIALRERWYHNIETMINILHNKGFIWGDFSPNNMITDEDDMVWIIDFGGGYTEGWVEQENMETKRGDLEGLKRLKEYLLGMN